MLNLVSRQPNDNHKELENDTLFYKQHFISNTRLKLAKNQAKAKQHPEAEVLLFENYSLSFIHVIIQK